MIFDNWKPLIIFSKVNDCQLICQVNRDLTRRVKSACPATWSKKAVQHDIQMLIKLIDYLDKKGKLWQYSTQNNDEHCEEKGGEEVSDVSMETNASAKVSIVGTNAL